MSTAAACFVLSSDRRFEAFVDVGGLTGFAVGCTLLEEVRSLCSPFVEHATLCSCFCGLCTFAGCDLVRSHLSASQRMGLFRDCSRIAFHCLRVVQNEILLSSLSISSNEKVKIVRRCIGRSRSSCFGTCPLYVNAKAATFLGCGFCVGCPSATVLR